MRVFAAICYCILLPCVIPVRLSSVIHKKASKKKAAWKNDVRPLPRRRTSLSSTAPTPQLNCALLARLPLELRLEIYAYVFGGTVIHLIQIPRRIAHTRCRLRSSPDLPRNCRPATRMPLHTSFGSVANANVALLKTCRQVYEEAARMLYAGNTFDVNQLSTFLSFTRTILPTRLAAITSMHMNLDLSGVVRAPGSQAALNWNHSWHVIATKMPGLRDLALRLANVSRPSIHGEWVAPIGEIRGLKRFKLELETRSDEREAAEVVRRYLTQLLLNKET